MKPLFFRIFVRVSLILLYSASAVYHYFQGSEKVKMILRKLDHSMIYILIVGTHTPVVAYCMEAPRSYYFLGILWFIAPFCSTLLFQYNGSVTKLQYLF